MDKYSQIEKKLRVIKVRTLSFNCLDTTADLQPAKMPADADPHVRWRITGNGECLKKAPLVLTSCALKLINGGRSPRKEISANVFTPGIFYNFQRRRRAHVAA